MDAGTTLPTVDTQMAAMLTANMVESMLEASGSSPEVKHDFKGSGSALGETSLCLPPPVNTGASAPQPREHRTAVCPEGQGDRARLGAEQDPDPRPGPGSLWGTDGGPRRLQGPRERCR